VEKAAANLRKHGISFALARLVFSDVMIIELGEDRRGYDEQRFNVIGRAGDKLLFVTHRYTIDDRIHIISARQAEKHEIAFWLRNNPPQGF
jgi:uncharacterized DUF497 family protein